MSLLALRAAVTATKFKFRLLMEKAAPPFNRSELLLPMSTNSALCFPPLLLARRPKTKPLRPTKPKRPMRTVMASAIRLLAEQMLANLQSAIPRARLASSQHLITKPWVRRVAITTIRSLLPRPMEARRPRRVSRLRSPISLTTRPSWVRLQRLPRWLGHRRIQTCCLRPRPARRTLTAIRLRTR